MRTSTDALLTEVELELDGYHQDGFLHVPGLVDPDVLDAIDGERQRFVSMSGGLSVEVQLVHRSRILRDFVTHGPQIGLAVALLGPDVCFTHQQFVSKWANSEDDSDVPWHQDSGYGRLEPPTDLTVWIPLTDTDEANGCLWVLPGSHRLGLKSHDQSAGLRAAEVAEPGVCVPMAAGDALLFSGHLLHRSLANRSADSRHAMYVRYCTPDVRMIDKGNISVLDDGFSWMVAGEAP